MRAADWCNAPNWVRIRRFCDQGRRHGRSGGQIDRQPATRSEARVPQHPCHPDCPLPDAARRVGLDPAPDQRRADVPGRPAVRALPLPAESRLRAEFRELPRDRLALVRKARAARADLGLPASLLRRPAPPADGPRHRRRQGCRAHVGGHRAGDQPHADAGHRAQAVRTVLTTVTTMTTRKIVVGAHYGLRDWLAQRFTAVTMAVYTLVLLGWLFTLPELTYGTWAGMFASDWMKVLTLLALIALTWHAWVGVRDIYMDYIKPIALRVALQVLTIVLLLGYACWAAIILWSV